MIDVVVGEVDLFGIELELSGIGLQEEADCEEAYIAAADGAVEEVGGLAAGDLTGAMPANW